MKSILDPSFKYIPSADTDIRKTFQRVRVAAQQRVDQRSAQIVTRVRAAPPGRMSRNQRLPADSQ